MVGRPNHWAVSVFPQPAAPFPRFFMHIIPVIDLLGGQVVRGLAGRRSEYRPMASQIAADSQPATIARALASQFGFPLVYVADLDAIMHARADTAAWSAIASQGLRIWLDAGVGTFEQAAEFALRRERLGLDATLIVGLESLQSPQIIGELVHQFGPGSVAFSLDLAAGRALSRLAWHWRADLAHEPLEIARSVVRMGMERLIVLDLADVGMGRGPRTLELCRTIRSEFAHVELIAGGGVRGLDDLKAIADAGCDAALVASALHDGRLTRDDIQLTRDYGRQRRM
jgi:phosphoribosylformimino-5-aminoimidazole carboxamide ribotide isomerase